LVSGTRTQEEHGEVRKAHEESSLIFYKLKSGKGAQSRKMTIVP
jgi:hypothetical protein